jgi:FtsZ-interacting cell division protein ZipA
MEIVLIVIVAVLVLAALLYLGRKRSERVRHERELHREKLAAEARGHREMADDHGQKAGELHEAAEREERRAERHAVRARQVEPSDDE